jgi:phage shock protein B
MALGIPMVAIICGTIVSIVKKDASRKDDPEQSRMIQEIYNSLERMEHRIESLETILYDKKDAHHE